MAIYYVDPFKNTDGTGTFADPKGMWFSTPFTLAAGDELRIIGRTLASMLTATEYTVTVSPALNNVTLTTGSYLDFQQHDIVYFPDYDVFMRLSAGTFNSSGSYNVTYSSSIPIPVVVSTSNIRMRLVGRTILPTFTNTLASLYTDASSAFGGITISDCWVSDGVRVTDGTVKTLLTSGSISTCVLSPSPTVPVALTEANKMRARSTLSLSNTHLVANKNTSAGSWTVRFFDLVNYDVVLSQVYTSGSGNTNINSSAIDSANAKVGYSNNVTIKNSNTFASTVVNVQSSNTTVTLNNIVAYQWSNTDNFSRQVSDVVISYENVIFNTNSSDTCFVSGRFSRGITVKLGLHRQLFSSNAITTIIRGNGNINIEYLPNFNYSYQWATTPVYPAGFYTVTDSLTLANTANETYYKIPALPSGKTDYGFRLLTLSGGAVTNIIGKRAITRKAIVKNLQNGLNFSNISFKLLDTNITITSSDGLFSPVEFLGVKDASYYDQTNISQIFYFIASQDNVTFKSVSPSLKFNLTTFDGKYWISDSPTRKARAYKNTAIPCVNGTPITVSGWVRTSDTSYVSGDFSVSLVNANGDDVATEFVPTAAFINGWQQFSFTVTPTYTGELFLAFGMTGYRGGQTYWVSDMGVS